MNLMFLIPLSISLLSGYLFKKSADEMAYLTGIGTIVCGLLAVILAPWQLQLLILGFVFLSTKNRLQQNEYRMGFDSKQEKRF